eukprot:2860339-Alexandrium_andersonii.AAC.1
MLISEAIGGRAMKDLDRRFKAMRAKQRGDHRLREVELEVAEVRVFLEDLHDAREVAIVPEDDRRVIGKGEDHAIVTEGLLKPSQEE